MQKGVYVGRGLFNAETASILDTVSTLKDPAAEGIVGGYNTYNDPI